MNTSIRPAPPASPIARLGRPVQITLICICLGVAGLLAWHWLQPVAPNAQIPADFPNTWIAEQNDGHPERIVIVPGRTEPPAPHVQDGVKLFPAWCCLNEKCPGRHDGQPFVFAHWDMRPCPKCGNLDPKLLQRFNTPEGEAMLVEIRRSFGQ